jgi:hypothetical protein
MFTNRTTEPGSPGHRPSRFKLLRPIRHPAATGAGLAATLLAAPGALARPAPPAGTRGAPAPARPAPVPVHLPHLPPGWNKHPPLPAPAHLHTATAAGLTGWQITLIAAGAAILAAVATLAARARAARRHQAAPST